MEDYQSLKKRFLARWILFILLNFHSFDYGVREGILYYNLLRATGNVPIELSEFTGDLTPMGLIDVVKAAGLFLYKQIIYYWNLYIS